MRVVLFTGKGGVGKTTVAAATATLSAATGRKTLAVSTDAAHSLGDVLDAELGGRPHEIDTGLFGMHVDTQAAFERSWHTVQGYLFELLEAGGVDPIAAGELTVVPGAEEILALLAVRDAARSGGFDVVCVDCAPTAETLRLLRLPDVLDWWLRRLYSDERRVLRNLRPILARTAGLPLPSDAVFEAAGRLRAELADVRALLAGDGCSVRLVVTPERVVVAEARRTATALALHGYRVDGVAVNRVLPPGRDAWRAGWVRAQDAQLAEVDAGFPDVPRWRFEYAAAEPVGAVALAALARGSYGQDDPVGEAVGLAPMAVERTVDGFALTLALPFASRGEIDLARTGDELVVGVGGGRRIVALPSALRRCTVDGAKLSDGRLVVRFVPDPERWFRR